MVEGLKEGSELSRGGSTASVRSESREGFSPSFVAISFLSVCFLFSSGCGPKGLEMVRVSGTVTVDGKAPPGEGLILFLPIAPAEGFPTRPATGSFDQAGRYKARSHEPGDGLYPGTYQITLECWKHPPNMDGIPVVSYIQRKYQAVATSGVEDLVVKSGSKSIKLDFDLESASQ